MMTLKRNSEKLGFRTIEMGALGRRIEARNQVKYETAKV